MIETYFQIHHVFKSRINFITCTIQVVVVSITLNMTVCLYFTTTSRILSTSYSHGFYDVLLTISSQNFNIALASAITFFLSFNEVSIKSAGNFMSAGRKFCQQHFYISRVQIRSSVLILKENVLVYGIVSYLFIQFCILNYISERHVF